MFAIGNVFIGKYKVWITPSAFSIHPWDPKAQDLSYFEVLVSHEFCDKPERIYSIVDLSNSEDFKEVFPLDSQKRATSTTDLISFQAYSERKGSVGQLWKLSRVKVEKLLEICQMLGKSQDNL